MSAPKQSVVQPDALITPQGVVLHAATFTNGETAWLTREEIALLDRRADAARRAYAQMRRGYHIRRFDLDDLFAAGVS